MTILNWVIDVKNQKIILIGVIILLVLLLWKGCSDKAALESANLQANNNILALNDTVRVEKTKNGETQFIKNVLITDLKNLKDMNVDLYDEVKNQKNTIFYISQLTASIQDVLKKQSNGDKAVKDPGTGADMVSWNFDTIGTDWSRTLAGKSLFTVKLDSGKYTVTPQFSVLSNFNQNMKKNL